MQHSVQRGFQGYCLSLSGGFSASRLVRWLLGFSASRLLGFSACPAASRLRGFSASRLARRLLGFAASRLLGLSGGFSASRLLGFLASRLVPGFSASRLLGFSACVVLRGFSASRLLGLCRASRLLGFSASGRISGPLLPVLCISPRRKFKKKTTHGITRIFCPILRPNPRPLASRNMACSARISWIKRSTWRRYEETGEQDGIHKISWSCEINDGIPQIWFRKCLFRKCL